MLRHESMTAYEIDNSLLKEFGSKRSPNVVYTKLASMERNKLITCVHSKHGRIYRITEKGRKIANNSPIIIKDIQKFAALLLR